MPLPRALLIVLRSPALRSVWRLGLAAVAIFLLASVALVWSGANDELGVADVALVLGNTVNADGTLSPRLQARLDRTLELYRSHQFTHIIVSGGVGREGRDEAVAMRDYLTAHEVPASAIIVDGAGLTTFDSARHTARIMREHGWTSVLAVSQYFHLPRTRLALSRCGVRPVYWAHANYMEWRDLYSIPREVFGCLGYSFRVAEDDAVRSSSNAVSP